MPVVDYNKTMKKNSHFNSPISHMNSREGAGLSSHNSLSSFSSLSSVQSVQSSIQQTNKPVANVIPISTNNTTSSATTTSNTNPSVKEDEANKISALKKKNICYYKKK
jgi:hypothetical protein